MGEILDITQFSVAVSSVGLFLLLSALRVRPSKSWEPSSRLKIVLLAAFGCILQIPVIISIIDKPDIVTDTLSTEKWSWRNLFINYLVMLALAGVVFVLSRWLGDYKASK